MSRSRPAAFRSTPPDNCLHHRMPARTRRSTVAWVTAAEQVSRPVLWTSAQRSPSLTARLTSQRMFLFPCPTAASATPEKILALMGRAEVVIPECQTLLMVSQMHLSVARIAERPAARAGAAMPGCQTPLTASRMLRSVAPVATLARAGRQAPAALRRQAEQLRAAVRQVPAEL
jgi:hypothetical protein